MSDLIEGNIAPVSSLRDQADTNRLQNARDRHLGFPVGSYVQSPPMLFTRDGHNVFLGDIYRGRSAFLLCSGPSLTSHQLSELDQRGILTLALNNAAVIHRPQLWCSVDDPGNFSDVIWRDQAVWKFVPLAHMEKSFMIRNEEGELIPSVEKVGDMPGVFGFRRNEDFKAEQWLREDSFNWGNHSERVDAYGNKGSRSVMYVALRLLHYLGVRRIYLLGCDFRMEFGKQNYAFEQERSRSSVNGNNSSYRILNERLQSLIPYFERENLSIFNCTPNSGLTVFPAKTFPQAVQEAIADMPRNVSTAGMYDRQQREKERTQSEQKSICPSTTPNVDQSDTNIPEMTLLVPVTATALPALQKTWQTWTRHKPSITRWPLCLLHDSQLDIEPHIHNIKASHPNLRVVPTEIDDSCPKAFTAAILRFVATNVATPWFMSLDPHAVATAEPNWIDSKWFDSTPEEPAPVLIGSTWAYARPANRVQQLDDWGDRVAGIRDFPRLNSPFDPAKDRIEIPTISSWCLLGNTSWTTDCVEQARQHPPEMLDEIFLHYCAVRQLRRMLRVPFKQYGWDHSFSWSPRQVLSKCQHSLRGQAALSPS